MTYRDTPEYRAAQRERVRAWRQRNPEYHRDMARIYRSRNKARLCPGAGGYACMVWIRGDRILCSFCARTVELMG